MSERLYRYAWGNTPNRARFKGRTVRVVASDRVMNTCMVEDIITGERMTTSRNALRRA